MKLSVSYFLIWDFFEAIETRVQQLRASKAVVSPAKPKSVSIAW